MNLYLVAGHGDGDPGAVYTTNGVRYKESDLTRELVEKIAYLCDCKYFDFNKNAYKDVNLFVKSIPPDTELVVEVHFNCFTTTSARGCEIYIPQSSEYTIDFNKIPLSISEAMTTINRGVKRRNFMVITKALSCGFPSCLIEVCFLSSPYDMSHYNSDKIAEVIAVALDSKVNNRDFTTNRWSKPYVDKMKELGVMSDGRETENITREEVCAMLCRLMEAHKNGKI